LAQKLAVCQHASRREGKRDDLQRDRDGQGKWAASLQLLEASLEQLPQITGPLDSDSLERFMSWSYALPADCRLNKI
jgi:hypothetical protein